MKSWDSKDELDRRERSARRRKLTKLPKFRSTRPLYKPGLQIEEIITRFQISSVRSGCKVYENFCFPFLNTSGSSLNIRAVSIDHVISRETFASVLLSSRQACLFTRTYEIQNYIDFETKTPFLELVKSDEIILATLTSSTKNTRFFFIFGLNA